MKTYVTISLNEKDIELLGLGDLKEAVELDGSIHDVVDKALTLMVSDKLVQMKITNLPMREEA